MAIPPFQKDTPYIFHSQYLHENKNPRIVIALSWSTPVVVQVKPTLTFHPSGTAKTCEIGVRRTLKTLPVVWGEGCAAVEARIAPRRRPLSEAEGERFPALRIATGVASVPSFIAFFQCQSKTGSPE